jgi:hypothetical protein
LSDASRPSPAATIESDETFWPAAERGVFVATVDAPDTEGLYEITAVASVSGERLDAVARVLVSSEAWRAPDATRLANWTASQGGRVVEGSAGQVPSAVRAALGAPVVPPRAHPMRSPWWLVPFVGLLGAEWYLRRRRGER